MAKSKAAKAGGKGRSTAQWAVLDLGEMEEDAEMRELLRKLENVVPDDSGVAGGDEYREAGKAAMSGNHHSPLTSYQKLATSNQ